MLNKKSSSILFFPKDLGCPELCENRVPLKTHLYLLSQNDFLTQTKPQIQVQEVRKVIKFLEIFYRYPKVVKMNF